MLVVDAHAHVFTAHDLPIEGFLYQSQRLPRWLARLIDRALQHFAADVQLRERSAEPSDAALEAAARALMFAESARVAPDVTDRDVELVLRGALDGTQQLTPEERQRYEELVDEAWIDPELHLDGALPGERSLRDVRGLIERHLRWAQLLTCSVRIVAQRLVETYPDVDLFLPFMMDMGRWFDGPAPRDNELQLAATSALIDQFAGKLLPFVAYDPRADEDGSSFERVQRALGELGFAGVKIYCPLGYLPVGNGVGEPPGGDPWPSDAAQWDGRLERLFAWCAAQQVPIATHCSDPGAEARPGRGKRSSPAYWRPVLERYPTLRVNFTHAGGLDDLIERGRESWMWTVAALMTEYEGVYADFGHTSELDRDADQDGAAAALSALFAAHPLARQRIMFGTDWHLLLRVPNHRRYLSEHARFFAAHFSDLRAGYLGEHALVWLGLDRAESLASTRLRAAFARRDLDLPDWLRER